MSRKQKHRVGVIGLGQIGSKVSAGLRSAGFSVYVWNRSPRAEPNFLGSAVEVVDLCDTIQLFVPDDAALDKVIRTITAALRPRHVILAHPTIAPSTALELGAMVESTGARYLDAPFAGSRTEAANRQLVYYVGGSEAAISDARPVLQATGRSIVPVGGIGDATRLKLSLQILTALTLEGVSEMLALARAGGLKPEALLDALDEDPTRSAFISEKLGAMIKGNFEGGTPVRHLYRDLQLALRLAGSNPAVPATGTVAGLLFGAMKRGWATSDAAILARAFEPDPPPVEIATPEPVAANAATADAAATSIIPAEPAETPARSGLIPEVPVEESETKPPRRDLNLDRPTPAPLDPPKPGTAPIRLPALIPTSSAAAAVNPPARPPATPARPPSPVRASAPIGGVTQPPFPAAPPESPSFPVGTPHRIVRRLSDTTTNLQALLQSPLAGTKPVPLHPPSPTKPSDVKPVQPDSIGPRAPAEPPPARPAEPPPATPAATEESSPAERIEPASKAANREAPGEVLEAIVSEILPPAVTPVVPGDIRPTQRVALRPGDNTPPRSRLIREQKSRSWLNRLIGE